VAEHGARIDPRFFAETADWPLPAKFAYLYFIGAQGSDGITGVCHQTDMVLRAELGFSHKQCRSAFDWLKEAKKVLFYDDGWYWVVRRPFYTLITSENVPYKNNVIAAGKFLSQRQIPPALVSDFLRFYGRVFDEAKVERPRPVEWADSQGAPGV